ncbi:unnamed protein product [Lactuca virosa]|uniref:Uncharacterized protein n=1 Tax=Lactuca virosa TaxID=75947 RepID=A0AAU9NNI7_9ASTR|nr:unnamed protein product [Lactuca virosa]
MLQPLSMIPYQHICLKVTSLTGQIDSLAYDLPEVKGDKYSATRLSDSLMSSPKTPTYEREEAFNSLVADVSRWIIICILL